MLRTFFGQKPRKANMPCRPLLEILEERNLMSADCVNRDALLDANQDDWVTVNDVLQRIQKLSEEGGGFPINPMQYSGSWLDTDPMDGWLTPIDVLRTISSLNTHGGGYRVELFCPTYVDLLYEDLGQMEASQGDMFVPLASWTLFGGNVDTVVTDFSVKQVSGYPDTVEYLAVEVDFDGDGWRDEILFPDSDNVTFLTDVDIPRYGAVTFTLTGDASRDAIVGSKVAFDVSWMDIVSFPGYTPFVTFQNANESTTTITDLQGELFVSQADLPLSTQYLLGGDGVEAKPALAMNLHAEKEGIALSGMQIQVMNGNAESLVRILLYASPAIPGSDFPFAAAVRADSVGGYTTFEARMPENPLIVDAGTTRVVYAVPVVKSDVNGGVSGEQLQLFVLNAPTSFQAYGLESSNLINVTFVDDEPVGPNNTVVMAEVADITSSDTNRDGTPVPMGVVPLGQFDIEAKANVNAANWLNKFEVETLTFYVSTSNVLLGTDFLLFNEADESIWSTPAEIFRLDGSSVTGPTVTGSFFVVFSGLSTAAVDTSIASGSSETFVLQGNILDPNTGGYSWLATNLELYDEFFTGFDTDFSTHILIIGTDLPNSQVYGTFYQTTAPW